MRSSLLPCNLPPFNLYLVPCVVLRHLRHNSDPVLLPAVYASAAFSLLTLLVVPSLAVTS